MKKLEKFAQMFMPMMMSIGLIFMMILSALDKYKAGWYAFCICSVIAVIPALAWLVIGTFESEGAK